MYSNKYIYIYSSVMVIIVAAVLSSAASLLKPVQEKNIRTEKMTDILHSVHLDADRSTAEDLYNKYIIREEAINAGGEVVCRFAGGQQELGNVRPFEINLKEEQHKQQMLLDGKEAEAPVFPLFICEKDGKEYFIIPLLGKGLWGPVWGHIALESDLRTVYGVVFGHKGETPGLGAEISTLPFQEQFDGKTLFDEAGHFTSIRVVKGGVQTLPPDQQNHGVDAISGGTITSNGVNDMIRDCLENYLEYIKKHLAS